MTFPMKFIFALASLFMSSKSESGVYLSTSDEVRGMTGQLFVGKKPRPLRFDQNYKDQLWQRTENLLAG